MTKRNLSGSIKSLISFFPKAKIIGIKGKGADAIRAAIIKKMKEAVKGWIKNNKKHFNQTFKMQVQENWDAIKNMVENDINILFMEQGENVNVLNEVSKTGGAGYTLTFSPLSSLHLPFKYTIRILKDESVEERYSLMVDVSL